MIEIDQNDLVANTSRSSEENDLVGSSRKRKLSESELDQAKIENEENDFVAGVTNTGNGAEQTHSNGPKDEEVAACRHVNISCILVHECIIPYMFVMPLSTPIFFFSLLVDALRLK